VLLDAREHTTALYAILAGHAGRISIGISFVCEGAVDHLLGMLARANGEHARVEAHLRAGLALHEQAGLVRFVAESHALLQAVARSTDG
jgi:hypothetical protein